MKLMHVQAIFPYFTNLPTDVTVNGFHFIVDDSEDKETTADAVRPRLTAFYTDVYGNASSRVAWVDWAQAYIKVFDMAEGTPRIPAERNLAISAGTQTTSTVPTEVACVATFRAAPESGVRFQSLYNRIYLGNLSTSALTAGTADQFPRFQPTFCSGIVAAMNTLRTANSGAEGHFQWIQYGRASSSSPLMVARPIVGGWVDNGPDTQRRRSVLASLRTNWTF